MTVAMLRFIAPSHVALQVARRNGTIVVGPRRGVVNHRPGRDGLVDPVAVLNDLKVSFEVRDDLNEDRGSHKYFPQPWTVMGMQRRSSF